MESIKELYRIGHGPSSSHTMGPSIAGEKFYNKNKSATKFIITLFGSLALTGKGHLTDKTLYEIFGIDKCEIIFNKDYVYNYHPNAVKFEAYNNNDKIDEWLVFSVGGGNIKELNEPRNIFENEVYKEHTMSEILQYCKNHKMSLDEYVLSIEGCQIMEHLKVVLDTMINDVLIGINSYGYLPGNLNVEKKAALYYQKYLINPSLKTLVYAASLAVAEVNATGGIVVTSPTCGSCGVVPGIIYAEKICNNVCDDKLLRALLVGGLIGNLVKTNGSISGAEVGCQGEVGVACSMASAMVAYLKGATNEEIEYAAEIALEHHLGMTCDPIDGLVQIPCIERNAIAAMQAYNSADYAILAEGKHKVSFDEVVNVMMKTGKDLQEAYRETSLGGLAAKEENLWKK